MYKSRIVAGIENLTPQDLPASPQHCLFEICDCVSGGDRHGLPWRSIPEAAGLKGRLRCYGK